MENFILWLHTTFSKLKQPVTVRISLVNYLMRNLGSMPEPTEVSEESSPSDYQLQQKPLDCVCLCGQPQQKSCHLGADRNSDAAQGRNVLLVLQQALMSPEAGMFPRLAAIRTM